MNGPSSEPEPSETRARTARCAVRPTWRTPVRYPQQYLWYVFLSALDVMFTGIILHAGGREVNALADRIITLGNLPGLVAFKFLMVVLVVLICEFVGRRNPDLGHRLARWAILLAGFPVIVGAIHLVRLSLRLAADAAALSP